MLHLLSAALPGSLAIASTLLLPLPTDGVTLKTDYEALQILRVERSTSFSLETVAFELEVNGEPVDRPGGGGLGGSTTTMKSVVLNDYKTTAEGIPTHIVRTFEELGGSIETEDGEQDLPANPARPEAGLKIDIQVDDEGEQAITVVEGEAPENDKFMKKQAMVLALDVLLPADAVEVDATWELDADAIRKALGQIMPARAPRPEGQGRRRRGDDRFPQDGPPQGRRGGSRSNGTIGQFLKEAEWAGEAKLTSVETEHEGEMCALIEVKFEASGELPERQFGGGRARRERSVSSPILPIALEGEAEVELKGKLYFSIEGKHPVAFELQGKLAASETTVRDRGERSMSMYREQEGEINLTYAFSSEER